MGSKVVFVGNIPYDVAETQLIDIFKEVGPVVSFRLVFDRDTGKPKGFGFCTFKDTETAASAVRNLNNYDIGGRQLRVDFADAEKDDVPPARVAGSTETGLNAGVVKSTEAISKTLDTIPSAQIVEVMSQLKLLVQSNPEQARALLIANPQLSYAIFQTMLAMNVVDPLVMQRIAQTQAGSAQAAFSAPAPVPVTVQTAAPPPAPPFPAAQAQLDDIVQEQQKQLLIQVMSLTPQQIQEIPADQRAGILALRAQIMGS